jgi:hypothetical protein
MLEIRENMGQCKPENQGFKREQCKSEGQDFKKAKEKTWDSASLRKETLKDRKRRL